MSRNNSSKRFLKSCFGVTDLFTEMARGNFRLKTMEEIQNEISLKHLRDELSPWRAFEAWRYPVMLVFLSFHI